MNAFRERLTVLSNRVLDGIFVPRCLECEAEGALLCSKCLSQVKRLPGRLEPWARPASGNDPCLLDHIYLEAAYAAFAMDGVVRRAILALKYRELRAVAPSLGQLLAAHVRESGLAVDVVVPVPLHPKRLQERGYNQAELLARQVAKELSLPLSSTALVRVRHAGTQARSASLNERANNVRGAFDLHGEMSGQRVLVIDDVCTTGATLNACAQALKAAGALTVDGMTVAHEL